MPDPETAPTRQSAAARQAEPGARWWSRPSPWLWGLVILLLVAVVAATQVPRLSEIFSARAKPSPAANAAPTLSGPAYTQAGVGGREFIRTDLRGARLAHLDLRGKDFQDADAAGAVFAGSLLNGTNFAHADLRGADLSNACLRGAILTGADLAGADFAGADVSGAAVTPTATSQAIGWASTPASSVCPGG